jgi:hypothetical protein
VNKITFEKLIDHLKVQKLKNFGLRPPYDATINIDNVLPHKMIQQIYANNVPPI